MKRKELAKLLTLGAIAFTFGFLGNSVSAEDTQNDDVPSEEDLNEWMKDSGTPEEVIDRWGYDQKLDLYESGERVEYITSSVEELYNDEVQGLINLKELQEKSEDEFSPMATIPDSDLRVSHDIYRTYDGSSGERYTFYANYEWLTTQTRGLLNGSVENDKIGIALPSGWNIVAGSDNCKEFQSGIGPGFGNGTSEHGNCNGGLYDAGYSGYAWSLTGNDDVWHSGWVSLKADRDGSALIEAMSEYAQASSPTVSIGASFGWLNVSFTGSGVINQRAWHTD